MRTSFLLSLTTVIIVSSGLSAQAETIKFTTLDGSASLNTQRRIPSTAPRSHSVTTLAQAASPITVDSVAKPIPGKALTSASALRNQSSKTVAQADGT